MSHLLFDRIYQWARVVRRHQTYRSSECKLNDVLRSYNAISFGGYAPKEHSLSRSQALECYGWIRRVS